jgi:hypothetical protein
MRRSGRGGWLWRAALALSLAATGVLAPASARDVLAADGLDIKADAIYRIDIDDAVVRVRVDVVITNRTPNRTVGGRTTQYYYDTLFLPLQDDARNVRATSGGSSLSTSVSREDGYREVTIRFPNLFYQRSRTIRLDYELIAGEPRSSSEIRVGPAFATFTAWAMGDDDRSSVRIVLPAGFEDEGYGTSATTTVDDGRQILRSGAIPDASRWYWVVFAERPEALTGLTIGSADGPIVIHAWPDDTEWRDTVSSVLDEGVPILRDLIDLPWPVVGDLDVYQVHTPLLEGYGGFYDSGSEEIRISEDLDPHLILHEASHAWFDEGLLGERWIYEGLAETYSARAFVALDLDEPDPAPASVSPDDAAAFPLSTWPDPERIDDPDVADREQYGYAAAWTVMDTIVDDVGIDGMQDVLQALDDRTGAYRQEGRAIPDRSLGGWRRFLDLVENEGGSSPMTELWKAWVVDARQRENELLMRGDARFVLQALERDGGAWAPPMGVLDAMARWDFLEARAAMADADAVLDARDRLDGIEATLGHRSPDDLESRYEGMREDDEATDLIDTLDERGRAASELIATRDALAVEPSLLAQIGLIGVEPATGLEAGLVAYAAGDIDAAEAGAATTMAVLAGAEAIGQERVTTAVAIALGVLLLLAVVIGLLWRRGRRRRREARLLVPAVAVTGASTTLAATPDPDGVVSMTEAVPVAYPTEPQHPTESVPDDRPPSEPAPGADTD